MSAFDDTMAALKVRFVARASEDLKTLEAHRKGPPLEPAALRLVVHRLAGAAGLFGYPEISVLAGEIDGALACAQDERRLPELLAQLESVVRG